MKPLVITLALLHGADAATTQSIINSGGHEALLPTQNVVAIDSIVAGEATTEIVALTRLRRDHPKLALALGWSLVGIRGAIVASNVRQLRK